MNLLKSKGRITNVWKEQVRTDTLIQGIKMSNQSYIERNPKIHGSNGTYLEVGEYQGTRLNINVTVYEPPIFEFNNKKYQVPERFSIECYENVREALNNKVFGNLAITKKDMDNIVTEMVGNKLEIYFASNEQLVKDNLLQVLINLPFLISGKHPFEGTIFATEII